VQASRLLPSSYRHKICAKNLQLVSVETMICRRNLKHYLAMVVAFLAMPQTSAFAQPLLGETANNQISPQEQTIDALKPEEIFPINKAKVTTSQELDISPGLNRAIVRNFEWQMRVRKDQLKLPLEIGYELKANNGQLNLFKIDASPNAILGVIVTQSDKALLEDSDPEIYIVKGNVTLQFDPLLAEVAGTYKGRLSVCVRDKNNGCI
jgi:hypothetical protein